MLSAAVLTVLTSLGPLETARKALDDLRCPEALAALEEVDALHNLSASDNVLRLQIRGICLAVMKKPDAAERVFRELTWVDPQARISDEFGPRVRTPFLEARAWVEERAGLGARTLTLDETGSRLTLPADPLGLITGIEVRWGTQKAQLATKPREQSAPWKEVPRQAFVRLTAVNGRVLYDGELTLPVPETAAPSAIVAAPTPKPPSYRAPAVTFFAAAAASLAVALTFEALSFDSNNAYAHVQRDADGRITNLSQRDAFALEQRVQTDLVLKTIFYCAAGAFAVTGLGFAIAQARVSAGPQGIALSGHFDALFRSSE